MVNLTADVTRDFTGVKVYSAFTDPSTQTPLFVAEYIAASYRMSDTYANSPRYLYYVLLVLVFFTQWNEWLANLFVGVIATFAGTAAIQAMILLTYQTELPPPQIVSIPYIDPGSVAGNTTLSAITNLVTNMSSVVVQPAALDTDIDALLAVTVSSFLMMLPYHTWSSAIRANRARHVLIFMWNMLMLGGAVCALVLWPALFDVPLQYRFCYPSMLDKDTFSTGSYASSLPGEDWNSTIWNTFANFNRANNLSSNCIYPSFNTSQILRRPGTIVATIKHTDSARANSELYWAGILALSTSLTNEKNLANLMYIAIIITAVVMVIILVFVLTPIRHITRVPVHKPKELIRGRRVFHVLLGETINGILEIVRAIRSPSRTIAQIRNAPHRTRRTKILRYARYWTDMLALIVLFVAMILTPVTIIIFVVWIEWYIERDLVSTELPAQVGQWTTSVSIGLVLISALVLRLRYIIATKTDIQGEIADAQKHLEFLETLLEKKTKTEHEYRMRSRSIATIRELELADDHGTPRPMTMETASTSMTVLDNLSKSAECTVSSPLSGMSSFSSHHQQHPP